MSKLIRVRTDDVLVHSEPMKGREFEKWRKHHNWVMEAPDNMFHTAAILCKEIQDFPEAISFIQGEVEERSLGIDLHGWEHVDYNSLEQPEIEEHLEKSFIFLEKTFGCLPFRWCTPWGANSEAIVNAAKKFSLSVEGTSDPVIDQHLAAKIVKEANSVEPLFGKTIMVHWFERGLLLYRICQTAKYGSWTAAAKQFPEYF